MTQPGPPTHGNPSLADHLLAAVDGMADPLLTLDGHWRLTYANRAAETYFGRRRDAMVGRVLWELFPSIVGTAFEQEYRRAARDRTPAHFEVLSPVTARWVEVHAHPEAKGGLLAYWRDVTAQKGAEAALRESTQLLRAISETTGDVIYAKDRQGRLTYANPATLRLIGKPLERVIGRTDLELLEDKDAARRVMANDARIMSSGVAEELEEVVPLPDGTSRVWLSRKVPQRDAGGEVVGLLGVSRDITGRKRAEEALRRNDQRWNAAIEAFNEGVIIATVDEQVVYWNPAAQRMHGFTRTGEGIEPLAETPNTFELWYPDRSRKLEFDEWPMRRIKRGEVVRDLELRLRRPEQGWEKYVSYSGSMVQMSDGERLIFLSVHDLSEQQRAEEALRESEGRFRAVLENLPVGVFIADASGQLVHANPMARHIWGQSPLLPMEQYEEYKAWWPETGQRLSSDDWALTKAIKAGVTIRDEMLDIESFDGTRKVIRNFATRVRGNDGENYGGISVLQDITDRQRAESALRESEDRLRQMADAMPQIVWVTRADGYHEYFNRRWYEFTGVPAGSTDGEGWAGLFHPEDQQRAWARWRHSLATGETYEIEYRLRRRDGQYRWTLGRAMPVRNERGEITKWFGTCTDVHDAKLAREELARAKEAAERANRAKDQFLAVLSHELRTPLTPVLLAVAGMETEPGLPPQVRDDLAMIRQNLALETRLIDDLLDLSRVANGKMALHRQPLSVHPLLRAVGDLLASDFRDKRVELRWELAAGDDRVVGDAARLHQVFWNLMKNAAKFTPAGGTVTVRTANRAAKLLRVEVADSGIGIKPTLLTQVFDAFEQGEAGVTRQFGGLGLGLAISKSIVAMHGGTITAASEGKGKGACFAVELVTTGAAGTISSPTMGECPTRNDAARRPLRVLLVDDNEPTLRMLRRLLERSGHGVSPAATVAEAVRLAAEQAFDVLVSDVGLPDGSGHDLMRQLRERGTTIPAVALTGFGMDADVQNSLDAGFTAHLTKPVDLKQLELTIRQVTAACGS